MARFDMKLNVEIPKYVESYLAKVRDVINEACEECGKCGKWSRVLEKVRNIPANRIPPQNGERNMSRRQESKR